MLEGGAKELCQVPLFLRLQGFSQCIPKGRFRRTLVGKICSELTIDESDLLFGRYVRVLGWGVPDQEEPGKHPDKTATTWKKKIQTQTII